MPRTAATPALARLRILDLTRVRAGPTCVRQFADFGADVIKVESPPGLDPNENMGGPRDGPDMQNLHRNKRSMTLNLKLPAAREVLSRLVKTADVVVENYRPDVKHRLGIDYESLERINPRIILASISGFGQDGPYRDRPGFDQIAQGMSGLMSVTGQPGQGPMRTGAAIADVTAGLFAALGVMTALLEREHSGRGQWVQSSLLHAAIALSDFQAARYLMKGEVPQQVGNDHPTSMPTSAYKTADGHINVAASGDGMWKRVCDVISRVDLKEDERFTTNESRARNRAALNAEMNKALAQRPSAHWIDAFNKAGVPCGPIYSMDQVFADPQVRHIGAAAEVEHARLGRLRIVNQAARLSRTPATMRSATPEIGQHTHEVLAELGYSAKEIADLREQRVV
jgi:crotonobetainyl-CoA:carnitine CoA-transferase CaiB-like acyl-CoA transferase